MSASTTGSGNKYRFIRDIAEGGMGSVYLAEDTLNRHGERVAIKTPSLNFDDDPLYINRFLHEEWVGKRIDNPHVAKLVSHKRKKQFLYTVSEYIDGQTLSQCGFTNARLSNKQRIVFTAAT